jgi:hypothetical protein
MGRRGITWLELMIVASIIVGLVAVLWPSLSHPPHGSTRTKCLVNLRQQGSWFMMAAAENGGKWPATTGVVRSFWEQPVEIREAMTSKVAQANLADTKWKKAFYCPNNPQQVPEKLWERGGVSVWGYTWLNERGEAGRGLPGTFPRHVPALGYHTGAPAVQVSDVELALDVIVSDGNAASPNFAPQGAVVTTNHPKPTGANVLFLDGYGEWRAVKPGKVTTVKDGYGVWVWFPER